MPTFKIIGSDGKVRIVVIDIPNIPFEVKRKHRHIDILC